MNSKMHPIPEHYPEPTDAELDEYCELVRNLACPVCGGREKLNATTAHEVMSAIIVTRTSYRFKIACPQCLDKAVNSATTSTALIGWWGFPWGIVRSIGALIHNSKVKKEHYTDGPNSMLRAFVQRNVNKIEANRHDTKQLRQLIANMNYRHQR